VTDRAVTDWHALLAIMLAAGLFVAGMLLSHWLWLQHHGDGKCHPVPVISDDVMTEIIINMEN